MISEIVERLKARIADLKEENAALSAAVQVRTEIYDFVVKWRSPTGGISDHDLLLVIREAFDRTELQANALLGTPLSSNVLAFRKATQQTVKP